MSIKLWVAVLLSVVGLSLSPLQAMERNEDNKGIKTSTIFNRSERDRYLRSGDYLKAAQFATKVINEDPEALDNEDATIEDFRKARDIFACLAKTYPKDYLDDATAYAEGAAAYEGSTIEDYIKARDLYLKSGNYTQAAYYNGLLPENLK